MDRTDSHTYTYGDADWADLLTAFDGQAITYDASGNPLSYYNGTRYTFTWAEGRNLVSAAEGTNTYTYAYDNSGLRVSKTVNGVKHEYFYASGKLLRETWGSNTLDFFYDQNGRPYALKYNGTTYYYITNLQGDVLSLISASGSTVASYTYDPYGKVLTATGTMAETNPLRYRGYYYDTETGLYYLQSRYYDPTTCRFINADTYASTGQGVLGYNMFAYCLNNPVNFLDISGTKSLWYYLIIDSDFGFIHRMVQLHIAKKYGDAYTTEFYLGGYGRADVVDKKDGAVWEIKHAAQDPAARTIIARLQALSYIGGEADNVTIKYLGAAHTISGTFYVTCLEYNYEVTYWSPSDGVILYSVREVQSCLEEPLKEYVPQKEKSKLPADKKNTIPYSAIVVFGGCAMGLAVAIFDSNSRVPATK